MSDAFSPSTSGSYVDATAPIVRYPPGYFGFGAAGSATYPLCSTISHWLRHLFGQCSHPQIQARSSMDSRRVVDGRHQPHDGRSTGTCSAMRDSRDTNNIPSPSKERITATYPGCCDGINHLKDEDLQYIPIGLCPACPEDLGCKDETNTRPEPILTNRAAVKALLGERDRLRIALRFRTPKNAPPTFPITPLPLLTPAAHASPSDGVQHLPIGMTSVPSLALYPFSSNAPSRVLTPTEQSGLRNSWLLPLMHNPSPALIDETTRDLDVSFPAYFPPNHAWISEWKTRPTSLLPET
ncbi:hypothetical protein EDB84DRAFT_1679803 [Lactarius hengduanensis]|nr:hypothetical protein EDB84DRAFT_1679803 [Lactarius hengduanensis]